MEIEEALNLDCPLVALREKSHQIIEEKLNKRKVLATEENLPRDWRGLMHLAELKEPAGENPTKQLLNAWKTSPTATLGLLMNFLVRMDRWDIVEDVHLHIREDASEFYKRKSKSADNAQISNSDSQILTSEDVMRLNNGEDLQMYDALILYADEDLMYAEDMMNKLRNEFGLMVCTRDNLVGGWFELQGVMKLINERCRRVILIISRYFVESPFYNFCTQFAQASAIDQERRIIIPCLYDRERLKLPMQLSYLHKLDFNKVHLQYYDFWKQLRDAISAPCVPALTNTVPQPAALRPPAVKITEINSTCSNVLENTPEDDLSQPNLSRLSKSIENISFSESISKSEPQSVSNSCLNLASKKKKSKSPKEMMRKVFNTLNSSKKSKKKHKIAVSA